MGWCFFYGEIHFMICNSNYYMYVYIYTGWWFGTFGLFFDPKPRQEAKNERDPNKNQASA